MFFFFNNPFWIRGPKLEDEGREMSAKARQIAEREGARARSWKWRRELPVQGRP